jgi:hypothetical protein
MERTFSEASALAGGYEKQYTALRKILVPVACVHEN